LNFQFLVSKRTQAGALDGVDTGVGPLGLVGREKKQGNLLTALRYLTIPVGFQEQYTENRKN